MSLAYESVGLSDARAERDRLRDRLLLAIVGFCTLLLYLPARHFSFVGYDDQVYVFQNLHVLQGLSWKSIAWAVNPRTIVAANWHPLTLLVELIIVQCFGPGPGAFHIVNALLHTLNAILLFEFFRLATGRSWPSFFIAILWALHPLRIESVVWISELKDVLCGSLWLGTMLAYLRYCRNRTLGKYVLAFLIQALALMAKPMAVTLPAVLLLLDYWPLSGRGGSVAKVSSDSSTRVQTPPTEEMPVVDYAGPSAASESVYTLGWWLLRIAEKLPLLALCFADTVYAIRTQKYFETVYSPVFPLGMRLRNGTVSYVLYLRDCFLPRHLAFFYPHPAMTGQNISILATVLSAVVVLAITLFALTRAKRQPYLVIGWLWFLGTLIPVIGLVRFGEQARADRYTYLPSIGITMAIVFWVADLTVRRALLRQIAVAAGVAASFALSVVTLKDLGNWQNTQTLLDHTLAVQPDNYLALAMRAADFTTSDNPLALEMARRAVQIAPRSNGAHIALGMALESAGKLDEAWTEFQQAVNINPVFPDGWDDLGSVRDLQADKAAGKDPATESKYRQFAVNDFTRAVYYDPDAVESREHLAYELMKLGNTKDAIDQWQQLVEIKPDYAKAQGDLADALLLVGDQLAAVQHYQLALAHGSKNPYWEARLAYLMATNPQYAVGAIQPLVAIAKDACEQTHYKSAAALDAYAACLARVGVYDLAIEMAQKAIAVSDADHKPEQSKEIQKRLNRYRDFKPYVFEEQNKSPATAPATTQSR
jgi:tetratricopeptide (TPR) repeat protein